jgi:S-adenosylmethionine hydrolase
VIHQLNYIIIKVLQFAGLKVDAMKLIVLLTDFGWKDGYAGILRGVVWSINPSVQISDLSHEIAPQNVLQGALTLGRAIPYFPPGTIFLCVIDPGVGTDRRSIAARVGEHYFVAPDNGLVTIPMDEAVRKGQPVEVFHLNRPRYWLPTVSKVFHGRDIFAPVAAHLANGVPLADLGERIFNPIRLKIPVPARTEQGWRGEIIHIDSFGNLATNLHSEHLQGRGKIEVCIGQERLHGLVNTFGEGAPGQLVTLIDSSGALAISIVNGSAESALAAHIGDPVEVWFVT